MYVQEYSFSELFKKCYDLCIVMIFSCTISKSLNINNK